MFEAIQNFLSVGWSIYLDAGFWVVVSLIAGGLLHTFVPQESFKKWLGKKSFSSIALATGIGAVLPICSCGVVPLGLTMYWSGASLAATIAFMVATPIINPAAAFMSFGLLGPELAIIYIVAGLCIPPAVAYASLFLAPDMQYAAAAKGASAANALHNPMRGIQVSPMRIPSRMQTGGNMVQPVQTLSVSPVPAAAVATPAMPLPRFPGSTGCT